MLLFECITEFCNRVHNALHITRLPIILLCFSFPILFLLLVVFGK